MARSPFKSKPGHSGRGVVTSAKGTGDSYGHGVSRLPSMRGLVVDRASLQGPTARSFATTRGESGYKSKYSEIWTECTDCHEIGASMKVDPATQKCRSTSACIKRQKEDGVTQTTDHKTVRAEINRGRPNLLNPIARDKIIAMLRENKPHAEIKAALGVGQYQITRVAKEAGLARGAGGRPLHINGDDLTPTEESHKMKVLRLVVNDGPFHYESELTSRTQSRPDWHLDGHNMSHILHALRKSNKVTFVQGNGDEGQKLRKIEATVEGRKLIRMIEAEGNRPPNQNEKPHSGPVERIPAPVRIDEKTAEHAAMIAAGIPVAVVPNGPFVPDEASTLEGTIVAAENNLIVANQPVTAERYPSIMALLRRKEKIETGAKALEEAGLEDLALAALAQIDNLTEIEREIIRFIAEGRVWSNR